MTGPVLIVAIVANLPAGLPGRSLAVHAQGDRDADSGALVQRLTIDRATTIVVLQKKADEREQEFLKSSNGRIARFGAERRPRVAHEHPL